MTERASPETKRFHLGDLISAGRDRPVSPDGVSGVYAILNWLTEDNLYTHQLPRAAKESAPWLARWFPWLAEIDTSVCTKDNWREWLASQVSLYGEMHDVPRIPRDDHTVRNPVDELREMMGDNEKPIIVVEP